MWFTVALFVIAGIIFFNTWQKKQKRKKEPVYTNNPKNLDWYIGPFDKSVGMPESPTFEGEDLYFNFPGPSGSVNELCCFKIPRDLSKARAVSIRFRIDCGGFVYPEYPNNPASAVIVLHRKGDDWLARDKTEHFRWYCKAMPKLAPGTFEVMVELPHENFKSVMGKGTADDFLEAIRDLDYIGIGFGGGGGRAHGVHATEPSRFTL